MTIYDKLGIQDLSDSIIPRVGVPSYRDLETVDIPGAKQSEPVAVQMMSEGAQFIYGLIILAFSLGSVALAITIRSTPLIVFASAFAPVGFCLFASRWKRWIGTAPYCYRLLTSLGEDAENILVAHEDKQRKKFVNAIGDLYNHTRPTKPIE